MSRLGLTQKEYKTLGKHCQLKDGQQGIVAGIHTTREYYNEKLYIYEVMTGENKYTYVNEDDVTLKTFKDFFPVSWEYGKRFLKGYDVTYGMLIHGANPLGGVYNWVVNSVPAELYPKVRAEFIRMVEMEIM